MPKKKIVTGHFDKKRTVGQLDMSKTTSSGKQKNNAHIYLSGYTQSQIANMLKLQNLRLEDIKQEDLEVKKDAD